MIRTQATLVWGEYSDFLTNVPPLLPIMVAILHILYIYTFIFYIYVYIFFSCFYFRVLPSLDHRLYAIKELKLNQFYLETRHWRSKEKLNFLITFNISCFTSQLKALFCWFSPSDKRRRCALCSPRRRRSACPAVCWKGDIDDWERRRTTFQKFRIL